MPWKRADTQSSASASVKSALGLLLMLRLVVACLSGGAHRRRRRVLQDLETRGNKVEAAMG